MDKEVDKITSKVLLTPRKIYIRYDENGFNSRFESSSMDSLGGGPNTISKSSTNFFSLLWAV